jgi:hypothetical protein
MPTLNINFKNNSETPRFPVYCKYGGQYQAQPAYIYLDLRDGSCGADYNPELSSTPILHLLNIILTFPIAAETHADGIETLINKHSNAFQQILDDSSVVWNGSNNEGQFGEKAKLILAELGFSLFPEFNLDGIQDPASINGMINSEYFSDWIENNPFPSESQSPEDFANELHKLDGENDYYFSDDMNSPDAILSSLREVWANKLYNGNKIPRNVAQYLLDEGTCEDSEWMDELKEFCAK